MKNKILLLLITLFLIEICLRIFSGIIINESGLKNLNNAILLSTDKTKQKFRVHPYLTYENMPNYDINGQKQNNNISLRDSLDFSLEKNDSAFRILCLGGSTTYGRIENIYKVWPKQLETLFKKDKKLNIQVLNAGLSSGTSAEILTHYLFKYQYLQPDLIIIHSGINDIRPHYISNYNPEYTHWRSIKASPTKTINNLEKKLINNLYFFKTIYSFLFAKFPPQVKEEVYVHTEEDKVKLENINEKETNPIGFKRNIQNLFVSVEANKTPLIYFPVQTNLQSNNNKIDSLTIDFGIKIHHKNDSIAQVLCDEFNFTFLGDFKNQIPNNNFLDICHIDSSGHYLKALFLYEEINKRIIDKLIQ